MVVAVAALGMHAGPLLAQHAHDAQQTTAVTADAQALGEVKKIDRATRRLTLQHDELKNLGMPPMTMAFCVADPAMLDRVKAGDRVRFTAERVNGVATVTGIEPAR